MAKVRACANAFHGGEQAVRGLFGSVPFRGQVEGAGRFGEQRSAFLKDAEFVHPVVGPDFGHLNSPWFPLGSGRGPEAPSKPMASMQEELAGRPPIDDGPVVLAACGCAAQGHTEVQQFQQVSTETYDDGRGPGTGGSGSARLITTSHRP
ncbi:hypothetical protein [Streptomyces sp. JNUCC 63]